MVVKKQKQPTKHKSKTQAKNKTQKGGRTGISSPSIKYTKGQSPSKKLKCMKCDGSTFIVKTLTMGTKTKAFFKAGILDNRFKVFTCDNCGFVQIYSNDIICGGKKCDPMF